MQAAGFEIVSFRDTSADSLPSHSRERERLEAGRTSPLGVHIVVGERLREMRLNGARSYQEGRLATIEALLRKPR